MREPQGTLPTGSPRERDLGRVGGIEWVERTNGTLTRTERFGLLLPILRGQVNGLVGRLALLAGRRNREPVALRTPPDSAMAREAEGAAAHQAPALLAHAYRTWAFGTALAGLDRTTDLDPELFYVAALLHDVGLAESVTGEDFTLRSAAVAAPVVAAHHDDATADLVRDAISAHATPGATIEADGPEAFYVQAGATCDLGGLRLHHLPQAFVDEVLERHPRAGLTREIVARIDDEAAAVPDGRFALLKRTGFTLAIRFAPLGD